MCVAVLLSHYRLDALLLRSHVRLPLQLLQVDDYVSHEPVMRRSALHAQIAGSDDDDDELPLMIGGSRSGLALRYGVCYTSEREHVWSRIWCCARGQR